MEETPRHVTNGDANFLQANLSFPLNSRDDRDHEPPDKLARLACPYCRAYLAVLLSTGYGMPCSRGSAICTEVGTKSPAPRQEKGPDVG